MRFRAFIPTVLIMVLLLGATAIASALLFADATDKARREFEEQATALDGLITEAMRSYQQVLRAGVALVNAMPSVTRDQWRHYIRDLSLDEFYPGIQGVGYVKRLRYEDIAPFVAQQRADGRPDYTFRPEGQRDEYTAIVYLEPEDWRNSRAFGYDMFSETRRRAAMTRARDTGEAALSRKVALIQETNKDVQSGTLVYMPVYADGTMPDTVEGRRAALTGYVYGVFRMGDFLPRMIQRHLPGIFQRLNVRIYDGPEALHEDLMFDDSQIGQGQAAAIAPASSKPLFSERRTIDVAGTPWTMELSSKPSLEGLIDRSKAWMALLGGGIISLLIAGIVAALAYAGERYASAERVLSAEVAERKRAQEQAQLANRELVHRVKNMLAIVTAIASQTARYSSTVEGFNKAFRERLSSLARVHDLLRPDPAHTPDFGALVREILAPYCHWKGALTAEGPAVEITQNEAVLLSLLFNELATNATKYGAWTVPSGQVRVTWQHTREEGDGPAAVHIVWQERHGPRVEEPTSKGFGTNVMKFAIERGLRGRIATSFDPSGVRHEVHLPRATAPSETQTQAVLTGEEQPKNAG